MPSIKVSRASINKIIEFEVTSREVYTRKYERPIWPEGFSGITIGIGYDLGYVTVKQFMEDWGGVLSGADL